MGGEGGWSWTGGRWTVERLGPAGGGGGLR